MTRLKLFTPLLCIATLLLFNCNENNKLEQSQALEITSSNQDLVNVFNWATQKALSFVQTGKTGPINISERNETPTEALYIPSYWAGYPLRTAFYSRDFCHQIIGAHLLNLEDENFSMMKAFAASATESKKWYPLWAINFDGSPYQLDYRNDNDFVREIPAVFELVEKAYTLYQWTGDKRYLEDEILWNYYTKAVTDFITLHDNFMPNSVAEGTGTGSIFKGTATFNEQRDHPFIEAGDGIACQYKALWAYSKMAEERNKPELSLQFSQKANALKTYFNKKWGTANTNTYIRGYTMDKTAYDGWGKENSWFMPMKNITDSASERTIQYLKYIDERLESKDDIPDNIEAISYIPELFFQYHHNETGWKWMKYIISKIDQTHAMSNLTGNNGNYPEVSYVLISNVVENLLGVQPDAANNKITTLSHLPKDINELGANNITIGSSKINIEHLEHKQTKLKYKKGKSTLLWEARFSGTYEYLYVDGKKTACAQSVDYGTTYSYVSISLNPNQEVIVTTL